MDTTVTLPGGLWLDGQCYRQVGLRPLTGADEAYLQEDSPARLPAETTTAVLSRTLTHFDGHPLPCPPGDLARALTLGDREALLLHLRRITLGEQMPCVLPCPACRAPMDLDLRIADLLLPPYAPQPVQHTVEIGKNGGTQTITFRLPTGADQEIAARQARHNPNEAAANLLRRCLGTPPEEPLAPKIADALAAEIAQRDPQAEIQLSMACPECGHTFTALFDTAAYFFKELSDRAPHLYQQVHVLAFYYHWSEAEIMGMTAVKRRRYLNLLADSLSEAAAR